MDYDGDDQDDIQYKGDYKGVIISIHNDGTGYMIKYIDDGTEGFASKEDVRLEVIPYIESIQISTPQPSLAIT